MLRFAPPCRQGLFLTIGKDFGRILDRSALWVTGPRSGAQKKMEGNRNDEYQVAV